MDAPTDLMLINACLDGSEEAFEELLGRYKNLVYSIIIRRYKNPDDAADIAQEVFLKAYKNLARYNPEFKFSTWLMRITGNHIIDMHRKARIETVPYESHENYSQVGMSAEDAALRREKTTRINEILSGLPNIYKIPVVLFHRHGLSYQEIADKLHEPISKVKNRIFRARKLLKDRLTDESDGGKDVSCALHTTG